MKTRELSSFLILLVTFLTECRFVMGDCWFPLEWQSQDWFTHYTDSVNIKVYTSNNTITWDDKGDTAGAAAITCSDGQGDVASYTYVMAFDLLPSVMICVQETLGNTGVSMLRRYKYLAYDPSQTAQMCSQGFGSESKLEWHMKYNDSMDPPILTAGSTPIREGVYQTTYEETAGTVMCSEDVTSLTTVTNNTFIIQTCYTGTVSYAQPFIKNLTVVDQLPGSVLDDATYGDAMLLVDESDASKPRFYCARYAEIDGKFHFSLNVQDDTAVECYTKKSYSEAGTGFVAFTLSNFTLPTTTTSPTTSPKMTSQHISVGQTSSAPPSHPQTTSAPLSPNVRETTSESTTARTTSVSQTSSGATSVRSTTADRTTADHTTSAAVTGNQIKVGVTTAEPTTNGTTTSAQTTSSHTTSAHTTGTHTTSAHTTNAHTTSAHTTSAYTTGKTTGSAHTTSSPTTSSPTTSAPTTSAHTTSAHTTSAYTASAHTTSAHTTSSHTTSAQTTSAHTTSAHTTSAHTTSAHTTSSHTTSSHTTSVHTTGANIADAQKTSAHTTNAQTTSAHTTSGPTTSTPTRAPITSVHTTSSTTNVPTTRAQTTSASTTRTPTTSSSTTSTPTTSSTTPSVTTSSTTKLQTTTTPALTTAAVEPSQHVQITATNDYDTAVGDNQAGTDLSLRDQLTVQTTAESGQIQNVRTSSGSVVIDLDILPGSRSSSPSVSTVLSNIKALVENNALLLTTPSGSTLKIDPNSFKSQTILPGGPCSSNPCLQGGTCTSVTSVTYTCSCRLPYVGPTCDTDSTIPTGEQSMSILIGLIAALGFILLAIGVYVCFVARRRKRKQQPAEELPGRTLTGFGKDLTRDEEGLFHAMSWKVSYVNNERNVYQGYY